MRFKISLQIKNSKTFLPVDYQYAMASAVYKLIAKGDQAYSGFLHDEGFSAGGLKRFKLFTFSPLKLPKFTLWKEKGVFELHGYTLSFVVSFMADKAAEAFVKGMFQDQAMEIGDKIHTLCMEVTSVEALAVPVFTPVVHYRCLSPVVIKISEENKKHETYLPPDDERYEEFFLQNLISKCAAMATLGKALENYTASDLCFQLEGGSKSKLVVINPYTEQQTKVRGFVFDFTLTAPDHMHEMGFYAGFGMNNAMGFGCGELR